MKDKTFDLSLPFKVIDLVTGKLTGGHFATREAAQAYAEKIRAPRLWAGRNEHYAIYEIRYVTSTKYLEDERDSWKTAHDACLFRPEKS